jgi:DNA-binding transcriptional regulator YiaG
MFVKVAISCSNDPMRNNQNLLPTLSERSTLLQQLPTPQQRRVIRERSGHTLREFGDALGVTSTTVLGWEQGRSPSRHVLQRYVELLEGLGS